MFEESQIYRIDHYLGKETVQNLMALRFGNALFEPLWNAAHIDHVQITAAESIGVGGREGYYDQAGALRDMVQNHMMQLLSLVAMEPPARMDADAVRDEKIKVLRALKPIDYSNAAQLVVRGQYRGGVGAPGTDGELHRGHRQSREHHRDLRRHQGRDRELALGGRAVLSAHRQAPAAAHLRDRAHLPQHSRTRSSSRAPARSSPTDWCCASSRTRASSCG